MMNSRTWSIIAILFMISCKETKQSNHHRLTEKDQIICSSEMCQGTYKGPEFINGSDIAHQFSNKMSHRVGKQLKDLYDLKMFSMVDFSNIYMSTQGMGTGQVQYELRIPFRRVQEKCESFTSFDHVGGWNHKPELASRKIQLNKALLKGDALNVSDIKTTKEGLQEYWIQWRNKEKQKDCI